MYPIHLPIVMDITVICSGNRGYTRVKLILASIFLAACAVSILTHIYGDYHIVN